MSIIVGIIIANTIAFTIGSVYILGKLTAIGGERLINKIKGAKK